MVTEMIICTSFLSSQLLFPGSIMYNTVPTENDSLPFVSSLGIHGHLSLEGRHHSQYPGVCTLVPGPYNKHRLFHFRFFLFQWRQHLYFDLPSNSSSFFLFFSRSTIRRPRYTTYKGHCSLILTTWRVFNSCKTAQRLPTSAWSTRMRFQVAYAIGMETMRPRRARRIPTVWKAGVDKSCHGGSGHGEKMAKVTRGDANFPFRFSFSRVL